MIRADLGGCDLPGACLLSTLDPACIVWSPLHIPQGGEGTVTSTLAPDLDSAAEFSDHFHVSALSLYA